MNRIDRPRQALAISLAGLAGFVDASGFMANGGYFMSFMSGNTTRLAVDLASNPRRAWVPLSLLLGFIFGVIAGALVAALAGDRRKPAVLWLVAALLLGSALADMAGWTVPSQAGLVLAMGALNNTFLRNGEVTVGLTYMTGALVRTGQRIAAVMLGRTSQSWVPHLALWLALMAGGITGVVLWLHVGLITAWVAAVWAASMAILVPRFVTPERPTQVA